MTEVVGVRFKKVGKVYYFDPCGLEIKKDMPLVVETARGLEVGEAAMGNREVEDDSIVKPLKKVVRIATEEDVATVEKNEKLEQEAFRVCEEKIRKHKLEMKLVAVEYTFDRSKILFYFSAEGRIDFRDLVKDLASVFRTRIELRQIGVRDEAKMIGGLGICGRPLCCSTFLGDFQPVSINMAKDQGLSLNPTKISGTCGRLMCCLKYENEAYQDLLKHTPPQDSLVDTPQGRGTVMDVSLLKGTCKVRLLDDPETPCTVCCSDCVVLRKGKEKKGQNQPAPAEQQEERAPKAHEARPQRPRPERNSQEGEHKKQEQKPEQKQEQKPRRERKPEGEQKKPERTGERPAHSEHPAEAGEKQAKPQGEGSHRNRRRRDRSRRRPEGQAPAAEAKSE